MIFNQGSTKATKPSFSIWEKVVGLIWTTPALVSNMAMITAIDVFASVLPRTCPNTAHQAMVPHTLVTTTVRNKAQTMQTQPCIVFQFINFFLPMQNLRRIQLHHVMIKFSMRTLEICMYFYMTSDFNYNLI